jgi:pSer/pThr/pTyr-binding forkhead associated (FHA) protein
MPSPTPPQQPSGTLLETDDSIRRALLAGKVAAKVESGDAPAAAQPQSSGQSARPYCPTLRPPTAILTVFDDGKTDGETIRIRAERFVIGRTEGDLLIPHDSLMSGRHVEITRQRVAEHWRWTITDLQTRNGLFVRASRVSLAPGAEILVGHGRYRFEVTAPGAAAAAPASAGTQSWGADATALLGGASLVEVVPGETAGRKVVLTGKELWIGSDQSCAIRRQDDPFVEPRHLRLYRDDKDNWHAQHNKTLNGLWLRVPHIAVEDGCLFQIGEQRFRLQAGGLA